MIAVDLRNLSAAFVQNPEARRFTGGFPSVGLRRSPSIPWPCSREKLRRRK